MKLSFVLLAVAFCFLGQNSFAQQKELYGTSYFSFQSNQLLNSHLFLYSKAVSGKFKKHPNDSLAHYAFRDKLAFIPKDELPKLNGIVLFYKDSLLGKDLLFDSLMRNYSDALSRGVSSTNKLKGWQIRAMEALTAFAPVFERCYWAQVDSGNVAWVNANKEKILKMEAEIVPRLETIYKTKLPCKVRVDLTCYATWAGAYSFNDLFCHVIFSSVHKSNKGDLAAEVLFHETSHFLVDKVNERIAAALRDKSFKGDDNLWHDIIFYTTGEVMKKYYSAQGTAFVPYYAQMKFEEKFPEFKNSVDACRLHWDPYLDGTAVFEEAIRNMVSAMADKK